MTTVAPVSPLMPPSETSEAGALLIALRDELAATRKRLQDFVAKEGQSNGRDGLLLHEALLLHDVGLLARQPPYARTTRRHELLEEVAFPAGYTFDVSLPRPLGLVSEEMRSYTRSYAFNTLTMDVPTMMVHWFVMCQELDLLAKFNISATTLREFFRCVHNGYRDNTYHNFQHAMDVAQFTFALYSNVEEMREKFNDIDMLACVVLGLAHDMDHPGVNNAYLIKIRDPIAILYNDRSVLENAHAAGFFYMLMTRPGANILGNLEPAKYERVRKLILSGILATDMSRHFDLIKDIVKLTPAAEMSELDDKSRGALIDLVAKASDICHVVRPWAVAKAWEDLVQEEFFEQGEQEKARGLEPMPMMDRNKCNVAGSQCWFYENMGKPLYEALAYHFPSSKNLVEEMMDKNLPEWKQILEAKK